MSVNGFNYLTRMLTQDQIMDIKLIKPKEAAKILMCSERTLESWRRSEKGPSYYKIEGKILYELDELYQFIKVSKVILWLSDFYIFNKE